MKTETKVRQLYQIFIDELVIGREVRGTKRDRSFHIGFTEEKERSQVEEDDMVKLWLGGWPRGELMRGEGKTWQC